MMISGRAGVSWFPIWLLCAIPVTVSAFMHVGNAVIVPPSAAKRRNGPQTALILTPGALIQPEQYESLIKSIQRSSKTAVWIGLPKLELAANPTNIGSAVQETLRQLQRTGCRIHSCPVFVGGHSLGGAFLPYVFDTVKKQPIAGLVHLGCILNRDYPNANVVDTVPKLTVTGDLDGLVRASRLAEDIYRYQNSTQHSTILVHGMNHFGIIDGTPPFMEGLRDLKPEISNGAQQTGKIVAQFIDRHVLDDSVAQQGLSQKVQATTTYLQPLLHAMELEGSYHLGTPCHECEDDCSNCVEGSPWAARIQHELAPVELQANIALTTDEFKHSWFLNPLSDPPFFHPTVELDHSNKVILKTVSEAVYEKEDYYAFDAGFFSNTAMEIRSKFNSPQAIWNATGRDVPFAPTPNACSAMNAKTIEWALQNVPETVRQRYLQRGIQLQAGKDIPHSSGPSWIWSYLEFKQARKNGKDIRILDSHTMVTPLDHPVPFAGGKLYCKLLSPARAMDWMYSDSLRDPSAEGQLVRDVALSLKHDRDNLPKVVANRLYIDAISLPFAILKQMDRQASFKRRVL